ncbi:MAG: hypothetical protein RL291_1232, partial [Pseudomonadota bacterium]
MASIANHCEITAIPLTRRKSRFDSGSGAAGSALSRGTFVAKLLRFPSWGLNLALERRAGPIPHVFVVVKEALGREPV